MITITTATTTHSLIDPVEVELSLSLEQFAARRLAIQATQMIERYCGRILVSETVTERLPGAGTETLMLSRYPVTEVTSVLDAGGSEITDYLLVAERGWLVRESGSWRQPLRDVGIFSASSGLSYAPNYTVEYTGGYTWATCPEDLRQAVLDIAGLINSGATSRPYASESIGDWSYTRGGGGIFTGVSDTLNNYRVLG